MLAMACMPLYVLGRRSRRPLAPPCHSCFIFYLYAHYFNACCLLRCNELITCVWQELMALVAICCWIMHTLFTLALALLECL